MRGSLIIAVIALLGLSACAVVDAGSTVVSAGADAAGTAASVAGDIVSAPFGGSSDDDRKK